MKGSKTLTLTGQLGDVMKESAQTALSWVRSHARELGIRSDFWEHSDIHVHIPAGAIPKDGPSAGVTMATALVSLLTRRAVRANLAMTGEITLSGPGAAGRRHQGEGAGRPARRRPHASSCRAGTRRTCSRTCPTTRGRA